jgi:hypothetical protein
MLFEPENKNIYFSIYPPPTLIHLSLRFTIASKPAAYKSFNFCLGHSRTWSGIICDFWMSLRKFLYPDVNRFTRQTLLTLNRKHFLKNILCIDSFCPHKTHNRTLLFGSTPLKHRRHADYWNQPLNLRMRVSYLDCHESESCRYLLIHTKNLLSPLQLFYFHFWPIYWLSLVHETVYDWIFVRVNRGRPLTSASMYYSIPCRAAK